MIKDESFYTVQGWMRTRLGLVGNELIVYALLFGFSQDGVSEFRGNEQYIEEFTGASPSTIRRTKRNLEERGLITRTEYAGKTDGFKCVPLDELPPELFVGGEVKMTSPRGQNDLPRGQNDLTSININTISCKKERKKEIIEQQCACAGARDEVALLFEKMTDEELVAWGEQPSGFATPQDWERFETWRAEMKKRSANMKGAWQGKLVRDGDAIIRLQSHAEIMDKLGVSTIVRPVLEQFLRHCFINHNLVTNDKLADIIVRLDNYYDDDEMGKVASLTKAINGGYFDIVEGRQ